MLRNNRRKSESKGDQKLFNLIVANYLNSASSINPLPFLVPEELIPYANSLNATVFIGTNYIIYRPDEVFSETDLQRLNDFKARFTQVKADVLAKKKELKFFTNSEVSAAHKSYMDRLHRYNEAKDVAQALLGNLAQLTGTTTRELYPNFNLSIDD